MRSLPREREHVGCRVFPACTSGPGWLRAPPARSLSVSGALFSSGVVLGLAVGRDYTFGVLRWQVVFKGRETRSSQLTYPPSSFMHHCLPLPVKGYSRTPAVLALFVPHRQPSVALNQTRTRVSFSGKKKRWITFMAECAFCVMFAKKSAVFEPSQVPEAARRLFLSANIS